MATTTITEVIVRGARSYIEGRYTLNNDGRASYVLVKVDSRGVGGVVGGAWTRDLVDARNLARRAAFGTPCE